YLNSLGVTACVLKYRHAPNYKHPVPLIDAQRAVRLTRSQAMDLGVAPDRIGIWGFSAGGHLASTVSTHFSKPESLDANDPVDKMSSRPDFSILCYPVVTLEPPHAHMGSRRNLLGANPDQALVTSLCNHLQVTKETPPTFLFHTKADKAIPIANSEMYAEACRKAGVPVELVIYDQGQHGVGLAKKDPVLSKWPLKLQAWLQGRGLLNPARGS
ncbi:MAG: alpha/beta hydrolase, partial [Planctomycetes bacterium]|nr:alpha/beta hydrolase [Planctomycetota bacterium]